MDNTQPTSRTPREDIVFEDFSEIADFLRANAVPHSQAKRKELIASLPTLTEEEILRLGKKNDCCPICLVPFSAVLASEEMAMAMDSPAVATEDLGVTRLVKTCGHVFCRKDITTWIRQNDSCPACRQPFITQDPEAGPATVNPESIVVDEEEMFWRVFQGAGLHIAPAISRPLQGGRGPRDTTPDRPARVDDRNDNEYIGLYS